MVLFPRAHIDLDVSRRPFYIDFGLPTK